MQNTLTVMTREDVKQIVLEALSETRPKPTEPEQYIHGLEGLASHLGISITSAWRLRKSGKLPFYQAGKKLFFKKSEIENTLKR